jgi:hypothetical protein
MRGEGLARLHLTPSRDTKSHEEAGDHPSYEAQMKLVKTTTGEVSWSADGRLDKVPTEDR